MSSNLLRDALNDNEKSVKGSKILILGVAYKKDIDDMRESPALSVIDLLRSRGAEVVYHDPFVPEVTFDHAYTIGDGEPLYNQDLTDDLIKSSDCVVICTEHSDVDYSRVCELSSVIVDTRNALERRYARREQSENCPLVIYLAFIIEHSSEFMIDKWQSDI